jgi:hypothetical protein
MARTTRLLLLLIALQNKVKNLELGIADYHRRLIAWDTPLSYLGCRAALEKLSRDGILNKKLSQVWVRNALVDSDGKVKIERSTKVYKRIYQLNPESQEGKRMISWLDNLSKKLFGKDIFQILSGKKPLERLVLYLKSGRK